MMERPDPAGGLPEGWRVEEWEAFRLLTAGVSYAATAAQVGRAPSTVSRWVRRWRDRWGDDVFVSHNGGFTPEAQAKGQELGGLAVARVHADNRAQLALAAGVTADHARALALSIIRRLAESPARLAEAGPKDVLDLARAFDLLAGRADALADLGGRYHQQQPQGFDAGVDLSSLEAEADGGETQELLEAAGAVIRRFQLVSGSIDVEEAS